MLMISKMFSPGSFFLAHEPNVCLSRWIVHLRPCSGIQLWMGDVSHAREEQWSTSGAREFPFGVVVVSEDITNPILTDSSVVFRGGQAGSEIVCFH